MKNDAHSLILETRHAEAGARFATFAGFKMPMTFTGIKAEHHAVRSQAGLFDVSHMGEIRIRGPRAIEVANGLITQCLTRTEIGQARYAVMCRPHGGIVDDLVAYKLADDDILLVVNAANIAKDFAFVQKYAGDGATVSNDSDAWGQLALQGPSAEKMLSRVTDLNLGGVGYYHASWGKVGGASCLVSRTGYTGEDGFELYVPKENLMPVYDAVVKAGGTELAQCGLGSRDTLRLEAKFPLYGQDLTEETNPLEAGMSWVIKFDKPGSFVGKDALRKVKAAGVTRRLRGFTLLERGIARPGYSILHEGETVGALTSGSYAPTLDVGVAMGYLPVGIASTPRVSIQIRKKTVAASVTRKPFYSRPAVIG